jgi:hypothetical protein
MTLDHQPGWTNTGPNYSWPEGWNFFGYFTVKTDRDAQRAFGRFSKKKNKNSVWSLASYHATAGLVNHKESGKPLWVHHYDCSQEPRFRLLECNCEQLYGKSGCVLPPVSQTTAGAHVPVMSASAYEVAQTAGSSASSLSYPLTSAPYATEVNANPGLPRSSSNLSAQHGPSYYPYPTTQTQQPQSLQLYASNTYGLPVNVSDGAVQTEQRSIHIANLPFSVDEEELRCLINRMVQVTPETVYLHVDYSTGKSKGSGVASFSNAEEARDAIKILNNYSLKGKKLRVRPDKNATAVGATRTPTIVDSSAG